MRASGRADPPFVDVHSLVPMAMCLVSLLVVFAASTAVAGMVYIFEGEAVSATERTYFPCGGPCDDPNYPFGPGPIKDDQVKVYQNVRFRVAFMAPWITANIPGYDWDGSWSDTSLTFVWDSGTETATTKYADSSLNTMVQTAIPAGASTRPLYLHTNADLGPTFVQTGSGANFDPGVVVAGPNDVLEGFWGWNYGASDPDPFLARTSLPVTPAFGGPDYTYLWYQSIASLEESFTLAGVSNLQLTSYGHAGTELPLLPPFPEPAASVPLSKEVAWGLALVLVLVGVASLRRLPQSA